MERSKFSKFVSQGGKEHIFIFWIWQKIKKFNKLKQNTSYISSSKQTSLLDEIHRAKLNHRLPKPYFVKKITMQIKCKTKNTNDFIDQSPSTKIFLKARISSFAWLTFCKRNHDRLEFGCQKNWTSQLPAILWFPIFIDFYCELQGQAFIILAVHRIDW